MGELCELTKQKWGVGEQTTRTSVYPLAVCDWILLLLRGSSGPGEMVYRPGDYNANITAFCPDASFLS